MKKLTGFLAALVIGYVVSLSPAKATEGSVQLSNANLSCEGVSIWRESSYKITGRCQGLVYPYETQSDHYVMWARLANGNTVRIDDIDRGYFEGSVTDSFTDLIITAEGQASPRRPSSIEVVSGSVQAFAFDKSQTTTVAPSPTPTPRANQVTVPAEATSTVGSVIGRILKALLVIVAVIIVVAVIASLLFRRRGSVSA